MFGSDFFSQSLQVRVLALRQIPSNWFPAHHKHWQTVASQVYGVDDVRARIGVWQTPWQAVSRFTVPDLDHAAELDLSDVMDRRALQILSVARTKDKRIVIMWSGGIDSTAVLASFIKNLDHADLARIIVCATTASVIENPWFYASQIKDKFEMVHWYDLQISNHFFERHILLHGDPGDCIFGPSVGKFHNLWQDKQYLKSWTDNRDMLYKLYHDDQQPEFNRWWVDKICSNLESLQAQGLVQKIQSISDWHWWNYFNIKWQGSLTRPLVRHKACATESIHQHHLDELFDLTFYAGDELQKWSYQNLHNLLAQGITEHKRQIKQYIYDLDRNRQYLDNKRKETSIVTNFRSPVVLGADAVHYDYWNADFLQNFLQVIGSGGS